MIRPKLLWRLLHINWVLVLHGLDELILATHLFRPFRFLAILSPNYRYRFKDQPRGVRIRKTLEDLGPIFVKFGQTLSTRRDLFPEDIAIELVKLQDKVPPFSSAEARAIIEKELGSPISENFAEFEDIPLASASIAQVHVAKLKTGEDVVVKVLRPNVNKAVQRDIDLLYELAKLAQRFWEGAKRLRPIEVVAEFEKTILDELDLVREAASASELRRNFEHSKILYIPKVYWDWTRERILVLERVYGIPIGDVDKLKSDNIDLKLLAERGVEIFFTQVLRDNFFHADMHPGNIFVAPDASYVAVDFGIVGSLTLADLDYLANNLLAFFNRDYRRVAELHIESEWVPKETRIDQLESAIRTVCEPIFEKPLKEISYGHLLLRLFQAARRFNAEVQPQLVLFQKTLLNIEGLGRQLYPELDLWQTAKPILEKWYKERIGPKAAIKKLQKEFPEWSESVPEIPGLVHRVLKQAATGQLEMQCRSDELEALRHQLARNNRRSVAATTGSAFIISSAVILGLDSYAPEMLGPAPVLSWILTGMGLVFLISAWNSD